MKSNVYYTKTGLDNPNYYELMIKLLLNSGLAGNIESGDKVALKVHSRDCLDTPYVNQECIDRICEIFKTSDDSVHVVDTDTLYHYKNEEKMDNLDINVSFDDEFVEEKFSTDDIPCLNVLKSVHESDFMVVATHFKGHSMIGFSGALKNMATGCVNRDSKIMLHKTVQPFISKIACLACNECISKCPENCISVDSIAHIDHTVCTGCNACVNCCPKNAIKLNKINYEEFINLLELTNKVILKNKKNNKVVFINSLVEIKPYYDCTIDDNNIVNDVGILISNDPVAIDRASLDLINQEKGLEDSALRNNLEENADKFKGIWRNVDGNLQLDIAEKLGLGTQDYNLINITEE